MRIEVTPREAKVFVDGYFAGTVDDYDGTFQRLHVTPGKHDILIYLEGYHSLKQSFYLSPDSTYKVKGEMAKLATNDPPEPPPLLLLRRSSGRTRVRRPIRTTSRHSVRAGRRRPRASTRSLAVRRLQTRHRWRRPTRASVGSSSRAQPVDAEIYIDGERWLTPDSADRVVVNLAAGRHHIEIHKTGFDSFSTEVDVRPGESTPINVSLPSHDRPSAQ